MIAWFARNHVAANLLMLTILFTGLLSLKYEIPLEVFPSFEADTVSVDLSLRGATPEDAELALAVRVEQAVADLEGIEEIRSRSLEGGSTVYMDIESGYEPRELLADIKARVDAIGTFPAEAEQPVVALLTRKHEVITVALSGDLSERELRQYGEKIRDDLLRLPEVTQVELDGVRDYELAIEIARDRLREFDLTLTEVAERVGNSSLDLSAGNIRTDGGDILIRSKGQAYNRAQFEQTVIKTNPDGSIVRLKDIATVSDGFEESAIRSRFNGQPAVMVEVYRVGQQSAIQVADAVKRYIDEQTLLLPQGVQLTFWDDDSRIVKSRIKTLTSNAIQGGILVLILLIYFALPSLGIRLDKIPSFIITLSLYAGAYLTEVFRAGLLSIHKGQREAGLAIGLGEWQVRAYIIVPVMLRNVLPALSNNFISLFKDTSLAAAIAVPELTYYARKINVESYRVIETWLVTTALYVAACYLIAMLLRYLEQRLAIRR